MSLRICLLNAYTCYFILAYVSPYWLSNENGLCIDTKNETVKERMECRIAFADMTLYLQTELGIAPENIVHQIDESRSSDEYPNGCIVEIITDDEVFAKVRWNESPNGQRHPSARQICKKGTKYETIDIRVVIILRFLSHFVINYI